LFKKQYCEEGRKLALLGATEKEIADFFSISIETLNLWKRKHSEFIHSLKSGKMIADATVGESLYERACGFSHKAVKIVVHPKTGKTTQVPYTEKFPPDVQAAIFWLTNRQKDKWKSRVDVKHDVSEGLAARLSAARKRVKAETKKGEG
jgi:hypothetical protein